MAETRTIPLAQVQALRDAMQADLDQGPPTNRMDAGICGATRKWQAKLDALIASASLSPWRPIAEHDESHDSVLLAVDAHTTVFVGEAFYDKETADWWWANETPGDQFASSIQREKGWLVTHWMPLPDPPPAPASERPETERL
jgi:hypothetical protein